MGGEISLDQTQLENVEHLAGGAIRAACPACRAAGSDKSGNHLLIQADGKFGCAIHADDHEHRREIFKLAGSRLAPNGEAMGHQGARRIEAVYDYTDESGKDLYQTVRYVPKSFRQRRPDGKGGWIWNLEGVRRVPFHLPALIEAVRENRQIYLCEGERDVLAVEKAGLAATTNPMGAGKWRADYNQFFKGAEVIIIADKDKPGRDHAAAVAQALLGTANTVKIIECPDANGKPVKDAADFFAAGGEASEIQELAEKTGLFSEANRAARQPPAEAHAIAGEGQTKEPGELLNDARPKVQLPGDDYLLSDTANAVGRILAPHNIFTRGGFVFTLDKEGDRLTLMTPATLRTWMEEHLIPFKQTKRGATERLIAIKRTISESDAKGILASEQFRNHLRPIERVNPIRMPVMRRDGRIELLPPGYDPETKSFTQDSVQIEAAMPIAEAKRIIDELYSEFVFADKGRSKAVSIGAMLTVYGRGLLPPKSLRPCFIYLANAEGAGKGLLVKCAVVPVLGYAPVGTKPTDEDEIKKTLLTAIIAASQVIILDNIKGHLSSAALEGFLTAQRYGGRILGESKWFEGENNALVFITGNGCTVSPDMRRRSLFSEQFMEEERAEDRVFKKNLEEAFLLEHRAEILSAHWSFIQEWNKAGKPRPSRNNSSFSEWSNIIGGIVEKAGYGCALETAQIESAADLDGTDMRQLLKAIAAGPRLREVNFDEIVETARVEGLFSRIITDGKDLDARAKATLGALLKRYDRRQSGEYRLILLGRGRNRRFKVEEMSK
jgi:5S rRNA maturation endonuclease (ribonuclease M5)